MKPFNLEEALKKGEAVTKNGLPIYILHADRKGIHAAQNTDGTLRLKYDLQGNLSPEYIDARHRPDLWNLMLLDDTVTLITWKCKYKIGDRRKFTSTRSSVNGDITKYLAGDHPFGSTVEVLSRHIYTITNWEDEK